MLAIHRKKQKRGAQYWPRGMRKGNPTVKYFGKQESQVCGSQRELEIKQQLFERFCQRMIDLRNSVDSEFCAELNPDVIVISDDQTMLFESQHRRASEWLHFRYGMAFTDERKRNTLRVHPSLSQKIAAELRAAGFTVNY